MRGAGAETRRQEDQEEASLRMFFGDRRTDLDEDEATLREVSDCQEAGGCHHYHPECLMVTRPQYWPLISQY